MSFIFHFTFVIRVELFIVWAPFIFCGSSPPTIANVIGLLHLISWLLLLFCPIVEFSLPAHSLPFPYPSVGSLSLCMPCANYYSPSTTLRTVPLQFFLLQIKAYFALTHTTGFYFNFTWTLPMLGVCSSCFCACIFNSITQIFAHSFSFPLPLST